MDPFNPGEFFPSKEIEKEIIPREISAKTIDIYTKNPYYSKSWKSLLDGSSKYAGFNFYAFLFGESWCVYRKQNYLGAFIFLASIVLAIAITVIYINFIDASFRGQKEAYLVSLLSIYLFVRLPLGFVANKKYFKLATRDMQEIFNSKLPDDYLVGQLRSSGGVNTGGFLLLGFLFMIASKLTGNVAQIIY
ncbi:MAG: hypothetical protein ACJAS1_005687 [Oleiphilaceae bacterium]|jgi:hypothetical protein